MKLHDTNSSNFNKFVRNKSSFVFLFSKTPLHKPDESNRSFLSEDTTPTCVEEQRLISEIQMADVVEEITDHSGKVPKMPSVATEAESAVRNENGEFKLDFFLDVLQISRGRWRMSVLLTLEIIVIERNSFISCNLC